MFIKDITSWWQRLQSGGPSLQRTGFSPRQFMSDLLWTEWHLDTFLNRVLRADLFIYLFIHSFIYGSCRL